MDKKSVKQVYETLTSTLQASSHNMDEIKQILQSFKSKKKDPNVKKVIVSILSKLDLLKTDVVKEIGISNDLYELALSDGLTGLRNRLYLEDVEKPTLEENGNVSYLMIDIDHFKSYNDSFRHQQGDVALTTVAEKVRKLSDPDVAIRYGGEEFSVILVGYDDPNRKVREHGEAIRGGIERIVVMPFSTHAIINILCIHNNWKTNYCNELFTFIWI